jgi:hypothetical protein
MKYPMLLLVASLFTGCYADNPYDAQRPVAYAGPVYYSAYPCEWGTCYYDGPHLVFYERAPVRSYYGGVSVHYYETAYTGRRADVAGGPLVHRGPSYAPELRAAPREAAQPVHVQREAAQPVQREAAQPVQREAAQPVQREAAQPAPHEHARLAQQEASRRAQHQPVQEQRRGQ